MSVVPIDWEIIEYDVLDLAVVPVFQGPQGPAAMPLPRVQYVTSGYNAITPNVTLYDQVNAEAINASATIVNPSGTPVEGQKLVFRLKDDGTIRTLAWGNAYVSSGATLPPNTTAGKASYLGFIFSSASGHWTLIAAMTET